MSIKLSRPQKFLVILSFAWIIISILVADSAGSSYQLDWFDGDGARHSKFFPKFFLLIAPILAYWAAVWIWGFGSFSKACKYFAKVSTSKKSRKILVGVIILATIVVTTILKFEGIENYIHLMERKSKAEQGDADAQGHLATNYKVGSQGVTKDPAEAVKWYLKAADGGNDLAQLELFQRFIDGNGLPVDYVKAYMWMNILEVRGRDSWNDLSKSGYGRYLLKMISLDEIAEGQRLAREWMQNNQPEFDESSFEPLPDAQQASPPK